MTTKPDFYTQDSLLTLVCLDAPFMEEHASMIKGSLFEAVDNDPASMNRQCVAEVAIPYWGKHQEPISNLLMREIKREYENVISKKRMESLEEYATRLLRKKVAPTGEVRKVPRNGMAAYLRDHTEERNAARFVKWIQQTSLQGTLTADTIRRQAEVLLPVLGGEDPNKFYLPILADAENFRGRFETMKLDQQHYPDIGIPGLACNIVGPGDILLCIAPFKRGKSIFAKHIGMTYTSQRMNVLHFDLENKESLVHARYTAAALDYPLNELNEADVDKMVNRYKRRMWRWQKGSLKVFCWGQRYVTIDMIENAVKRAMSSDNRPHAIIIDYDDRCHLPGGRLQDEKRLESIEVYQRINELIKKHKLIGVILAQAKMAAAQLSRVESHMVAENGNKVKDAACIVTLGLGPEANTVQFTVADNRNDISGISIALPTSYERMRFVNYEQALRVMNDARNPSNKAKK